ncbi:AAA family ATPase [Streptomyces sp. S.PB5]|uniref:AAA family ATPase n=1 Tax=Streptomyces sp. S.PB5 TaxID=3020844 RepID=UPI0025B0B469|nr:AAA family ATPase [Streptomyces sp. S.PB5]MDN3026215.1 AAA family ATPase [Streptomyces sp. S.PB5]
MAATDELISWGTPARLDRTGDSLLGRERELEQSHDFLSDPDGPRLVLVRGETGVGRSAFLRAVGGRLRAQGSAVLAVDCVPGDGERPLLLALRLVMALEEHRSASPRRPAGKLVTRALSAVDQRDPTAMQALFRASLTQATPLTIMVDDVQHADPESLAVLCQVDFSRLAPGVRLVVSAVRHVAQGRGGMSEGAPDAVGSGTSSYGRKAAEARAPGCDGPAGLLERLSGIEGARTVELSPLGPDDVSALVTRWLQAKPDAVLARQVGELTRGIPGAVDALLTGWTRRDGIRVADGHAFLGARTPIPVLPDDNAFVTALDTLGEPYRSVAAALSILGPLGRPALQLTAAWAGLSADTAYDGVCRLVESGILDQVPGPDGATAAGWTFWLPLTGHTVRERLSPVERSRLSAIAVEAIWSDAAGAGEATYPAAALLDEAELEAYLADRITDAGTRIDRERAVADLTAAAERVQPGTEDRAMLRWLQAATDLIVQPGARDLALQRYLRAAYVAGDYQSGRAIAETLLRNPGESLTAPELQAIAQLLVGVTGNQLDWRRLSRLATARWWDELPVPAVVKVSGQALALCHLARWQEAREMLSRTEAVWNTSPRVRVTPRVFGAAAELAMGRPEPFGRELAMPDASELPPGQVYALAGALFDEMAAGYDLDAAETLLRSRGLTGEVLPPLSRFLWHHLTGRWDEALESARRLLAIGRVQHPASDSYLLPARTATILLARGRTTSALRLMESMRVPEEAPPSCSMNAAEAEVLRVLGDRDGAEKVLRRGLDKAQAHAHVYGTEELWAPLAEVTAEAGRTAEAAVHMHRLEQLASRTGSGRARLRYLLASARVLRQDAPDTARDHLREAVELARSRGLPFETATTLVAAADAGAGPAALLHEAYELFGQTAAALWRFRTRTALREAGLSVPGRKQATAENDHLLATLLAEQLTTRQIATVLRLNEDAVVGRLTRLLARTGKRSRTELVTAVLTGTLDFF